MQTPSIQQEKVSLFPEESTGTNPADSVNLETNQNFSNSKKEKNKLEKNIEVSDLVLQIQNYHESAQTNDWEEQSKSNIYEEFTILNLILQKQYKQAKEQLLDDVGDLSMKEGSLVYWVCQFIKEDITKQIISIIKETRKYSEDLFQNDENLGFFQKVDCIKFMKIEIMTSMFHLSNKHAYMPLYAFMQDNFINGFEVATHSK